MLDRALQVCWSSNLSITCSHVLHCGVMGYITCSILAVTYTHIVSITSLVLKVHEHNHVNPKPHLFHLLSHYFSIFFWAYLVVNCRVHWCCWQVPNTHRLLKEHAVLVSPGLFHLPVYNCCPLNTLCCIINDIVLCMSTTSNNNINHIHVFWFFLQCHVYVIPICMIRVNKLVIPSQGSGTRDFHCWLWHHTEVPLDPPICMCRCVCMCACLMDRKYVCKPIEIFKL